ncbi:MAG: HD domain-containing phosphohydrolase [Acidaminococcaceae bacterium]
MAKAIAQKMKLPQNDENGISIAGSIHDIGKIQIPSEILCKPGVNFIERRICFDQNPQ